MFDSLRVRIGSFINPFQNKPPKAHSKGKAVPRGAL
jgi:hypothetical protein